MKKNQEKTKYSKELLQEIFDLYCIQLKAQPVDLQPFLMMGDNNRLKLSIKNYTLDEPTTKALCMLIPFLAEVQEIELLNNMISDIMAGVILLAVYMNPTVIRFVYVSN